MNLIHHFCFRGYTLAIVILLVLGTLFDAARRFIYPEKRQIILPPITTSHAYHAYDNPVKVTDGTPGVPGYQEVHPNDLRRFSLSKEIKDIEHHYETTKIQENGGIPPPRYQSNVIQEPEYTKRRATTVGVVNLFI